MVKNPVNPDLALWIGGVERLYNAGIKNLGVIHRGFSTYEKTKYRNIPEWQLAIELQNRFPDLPLICDPSHITGKRDMIQEVSQQALDLNYDGLIIETHIDPDNADDYNNRLAKYRIDIDEYDTKLLEILGKRMKIADKIGALKKEKNVAVLQNKRWNEILGKMILDGEEKGLSEEFILKIFKAIHQESISHQEKIING